ncbi:MAG TPA: DUF5611 family protein [Thermoplasmata archaeon]|nr:DUF5611 family protein [Thermoplasmata archaeon]
MQNYPVRASERKNLTLPSLEQVLKECFGEAHIDGDSAVSSFGAISRIAVRPIGRELAVDPTMDPKVPEEVARETIRRYNLFLESATGYSAKERAKRLRKSSAEGNPGA